MVLRSSGLIYDHCSVNSLSGDPEASQRRARVAAADVGRDRDFEHLHVRELDAIVLDLARTGGRMEVPPLAHDVAQRLAERRRPPQDELLSALDLRFVELEQNPRERSRL